MINIVADESVDSGIIIELRKLGVAVFSISEECSGIKDEEVLSIAVRTNCLLLTEDKDFGELIYRLKHRHCGILLFRLNDIPRNERIEIVSDLVVKHSEKLVSNFSVLNKSGLRIKRTGAAPDSIIL